MASPTWVHTGRDVGANPYPIPKSDETVHTNVVIPVSGDINLRGDLYIPTGTKPPYPAVVEITPYGAQTLAKEGRIYAARGYLFLAVDCRGRYRSEGHWEPLTHDRADGHQIIDWLARHDLSNGAVGIRGNSYSGYNQLLIANGAPDALKAMAVGVAPGDPFYNTPFQGGAYDLNDLFWLLDINGRVSSDDSDKRPGKFDEADDPEDDENEEEEDDETEEEKEQDALIDYALTAKPFQDVDLRLGIYHPDFRKWISHWRLDEFWKERSVLPHIDKIDVPALHISGLWDGNGRGSTLFFEALRKNGKTNSENQRLLMGPWDHDLTAPDCDDLPEHEADIVERAAMRDPMNCELAWFDHFMLGIPFGKSLESRVEIFLTGIYRWMHLDDWPATNSEPSILHFSDRDGKTGLSFSGSENDSKVGYTFDPTNPTPYAHSDTDAERMPFDNAKIQGTRNDMLLFDSAAIEQDNLPMVGPLRAIIYASADSPDFDMIVSLYDVYPDGRSIFLADGVMRARFLNGYEDPRLLPTGNIGKFDIDLWHIGHVLRKGHKLRAQIASGAHLRFDINSCTGADLATDSDTRISNVEFYYGPTYRSRIEYFTLPVELVE